VFDFNPSLFACLQVPPGLPVIPKLEDALGKCRRVRRPGGLDIDSCLNILADAVDARLADGPGVRVLPEAGLLQGAAYV
jgi:hypothetical protein